MNKSPIFRPSLFSGTASKMQVALWDECTTAFDEKQYLKGFHLLMDYINPELRKKYGNADGTSFKIPHGSIIVNISIDKETFNVSAPFLEVNKQAAVPLLRQICSLNFTELDLAQIYLHEERLDFDFSCKMSETNPYKIYYLLQEICSTGDKYDDEYVTKFDAKRLYEPIVTPFDADKAETAYQTIQEIIKEALEYAAFFESKRYFGQAWDVIGMALRQIDYYAHPQGQLLNDLHRAVSDMNADRPTPEVVAEAKVFMESLQNMDKAQFIADLYDIEIFVPTKRRSSLQNIQENMEKLYERAGKGVETGNQMQASVDMLFNFYNIYYHNNVQDDIHFLLTETFENASGKSWEDAASVLYKALKKIMEGELDAPKKSGRFSRMFGSK